MSFFETRPQLKKVLRLYGGVILVAILIATGIRTFLIEAFRIPAISMKPSLYPGDVIFAAKWPYRSWVWEKSDPSYGEVVIFTSLTEPKEYFIKRIVGLPGDTVGLQSGQLLFNGKQLSFSPAQSSTCGWESHPHARYPICLEPPIPEDIAPRKLPEDTYFLLSDRRAKKEGSKVWEIITKKQLYARALWIWLSVQPEGTQLLPELRVERFFQSLSPKDPLESQ